VLLDFGLSRFIGQAYDGRYAGTEIYRAPEVSAKKEDGGLSCAVDLWAAGIVLFVLLTGDMPFEVEDVTRGQAAAKADAAIAMYEFRMAMQGKEAAAFALLNGLLRPDPSLRWDAARALKDEWLERAPDVPAAPDYSRAVKKSSERSTLIHEHKDDVIDDVSSSTTNSTTPSSRKDITPTNRFLQRFAVRDITPANRTLQRLR
jgi:serine/threonine protein kinase